MPTTPDSEKLLNPRQVASILNVSLASLAISRCRRKGPAFVKIGRRIKYRWADIDNYISRHRVDFDNASET